MARTESLKLLSEIIDSLEPVGDTEPGTPLRSADWNTMVDAITGLAKLVVSREDTLQAQLEEGFAPENHDHRGQASLSWFEPETRNLLEKAVGGSADQRFSKDRTDKQFSLIRNDIKDLRSEVEALRQGLDQLRDADFARERGQGRLQNDIEALRRLEGSFDGLSERLTGLDDGITSVLTLQDQLVDANGAQVDIGAFEGRFADLEILRENLTTADGNVVRIRELESSIARLEQDVLARDEIDGLIVNRVNDVGFLDDPALLDSLSDRLTEQFDPRLSAVEGGLTGLQAAQAEFTTSLDPLNDRFNAVDGRFTGIDARLDGVASLGPRLDSVETRVTTNNAALSDLSGTAGRFDALDSSLQAVSSRVDGLNSTVALASANATALNGLNRRTSSLETTTAGFDEFSQRLNALETRTGPLDGFNARLFTQERRSEELDARLDLAEAELVPLGTTSTRLAGLERRTSGLESSRTGTNQRIATLESGSNRVFDERLSVLEERVADQGVTLTQINRTTTDRVIVEPDERFVLGGRRFP